MFDDALAALRANNPSVEKMADSYQSAWFETHAGDSQRGETLNLCGEQQRMFAMGAAIALRDDYDGSGLRRLARVAKDAGQSRRCLALAEIYDGGTRSDAARMSGVGLQVIRDWVLRFNAAGPKRTD